MSQMSVEQFASEMGVHPAVLLEKLKSAGVSKHQTQDSLTETDKTQLLEYLRKIHGAKNEKRNISLPRGSASKIKKLGNTDEFHGIQIKGKIRKKRSGSAKRFSEIVATQVAALRLEKAFTITPVEDGQCSGCSQTAPHKMANTNHGTLALCPECVRKALKRYKKWIVSQQLSLKKEKRRGKSFI